MRKIVLLFFITILSLSLFGQPNLDSKIDSLETVLKNLNKEQINTLNQLEELKLSRIQRDIKNIAIPKSQFDDQIIHHKAMSLGYCEEYEQARWVVHIILPEVIYGNEGRSNDFREDSLVLTGSASTDDYWDSGFDRGHLAPSADFRWSKQALSESYYYSNMSPQRPDFNRGIWANLEGKIRKYVESTGKPVYVVTGGLLEPNLPTIGDNKVSIPKLYYKVVYDPDIHNPQAIAFLIPNEISFYPPMSYAVNVDSVEKLTSLDFFPNIADNLEANFDISHWLSETEKGDVLPISSKKLSEGVYNTIQARSHYGKTITVCGTVVSTKYSKKGNTFLNLDQSFPNQVFTVTIWKKDRINFSYQPENFLNRKKVMITGMVKEYNGIPSMIITNEKSIKIIE